MTDHLLRMPSWAWDRVLDFLNAGKTGRIVVEITGGRVVTVAVEELGADRPVRPTAPEPDPLKTRGS